MLTTVCFLKGNFAPRWTIVSVPKMVKLLSWPSPIYWEINLTESLKNVGLNNPPTRCAGFSIEGGTRRLIAAYFVFKLLFFALFWHLWLCWRASYFISDHLLLTNLLRSLDVNFQQMYNYLYIYILFFRKLTKLHLVNTPGIKQREEAIATLQKKLPECVIEK